MKQTPHYLAALFTVMAVLASGQLFAEPPDLTQSNTVDRALTYNLGATGLRGWIYTRAANNLDAAQGRTTTASRQILVTHVGTNSPASGVMEVNDVILGVGDKPFSDDARKSFGKALTEAESKGVLKLIRFRAGKTENVQLKIRVMGSYSATAPYNCPKSKLILAEACKALEKEPLRDDLWGAVSGLALMATGKPELLPKVQAYARKSAPQSLKLELRRGLGMVVWEWGYKGLFLSEYYLLTGDKEVLPAIREYTVALAKGQSLYGTFGHGIADLTAEGQLHGSIPPYGPVNQAGLIANLGIVMGKKCGVTDPEILPAIGRASKFFAYFVDKGTVPYGEHEPWPYHENNGKSALAAVFFAAQGNQAEAARFFAKMSTAAYANREYGHTGQGFSYLWGALGANMGGPAAAAAFVKEAQWHLDLERRCDGSFVYDGDEQYGPGRTEDNTYTGKSSYNGLSPNATYVLTYSLPLKKLCITGRELKKTDCLSTQEVAQTIASGRFDLECKQKTPQELIAAFGDWSPVVRGWAAEELATRPEAKAMAPQLIAMAEGKDAHARQGACETLGFLRSAEALPVFIRLLSHEDRWLRFKAAQAIKKMGGSASPALAEILKALANTAEPLQPINWDDAIQLTQGQLAHALFSGPLSGQLKQADTQLLYLAIRVVSRNPDGMARATLRGYFENNLTAEDVQALAPDIFAAVKTPSPADKMFSNEIRMGGFKALTKYYFIEGVEAGVEFAKTQGGHGSESRTGEIMKEIMKYGSAARDAVPALKELKDELNAQVKRGEFPGGELNQRRVGAIDEAIKSIESATTHPELRSIKKQPQAKFKGPIKVFILAGQSNMEGHGGVKTLDRLGEHPTHGNLLKKIKKDDGSLIVRDDVFVSYQKADEKIKRPLSVGMGAWGAEWFGPELMFGIEMGDFYKEPVLLIKTCWGGHSLYGNFRPPSAGKAAYETGYKPEEVGASYHKMVKEVRECLANLDTDFPQLKGLKPEICGFVWFQGWNDMCQPGDEIRQQVYDEYCPNFVHLVQDLRAEFKVPKLPAVVGELGVGGEKVDKNMADFRAGQAKIATCTELKGTVGYVRTAPFWYPELDELPAKMDLEESRVRKAVAAQRKERMTDKPESADSKKVEQLVKEAGDKALNADAAYQNAKKESDRHVCNWYCHYQGSARVYCMVGYSLAEAMKPLLKTKP